MTAPSPLAPERSPELPPLPGVRFASASCGIRYRGRTDLMVALIEPGASVANVFTGRAGRQVVQQTADAMAKIAGCHPREVYIASTGVIGEPPPGEKIVAGLAPAAAGAEADAWLAAAQAIMTTDTFP